MANKRMNLSGTGKEFLDTISESLEVERPQAVKIALAKGLAKYTGVFKDQYTDQKQKWTIPDNIIKDREYLLFKHLIINENKTSLTDDSINDIMLLLIESGLRIIQKELEEQVSLEDYRISVLV
jgi:hypothetical protein